MSKPPSLHRFQKGEAKPSARMISSVLPRSRLQNVNRKQPGSVGFEDGRLGGGEGADEFGDQFLSSGAAITAAAAHCLLPADSDSGMDGTVQGRLWSRGTSEVKVKVENHIHMPMVWGDATEVTSTCLLPWTCVCWKCYRVALLDMQDQAWVNLGSPGLARH